MSSPIENSVDSAIIPRTKEEAKRLADLHFALSQEYRKLAGLEPIITKHAERHPERLQPTKLVANGTVKR